MKKLLFIILIALLFYTRFAGINWGLPYPMHPDERNMANAVQQLSCPPLSSLITNHYPLFTCLNPHFFAYGQFPLYVAYGGIQAYHFVTGLTGQPTYEEAAIALRIISALSSIVLIFVLLKIIELIYPRKNATRYTFVASFLFLIFQPYAIQFAHFGTTESLLMLFYTLIIYFSLKLLTTRLPSLRSGISGQASHYSLSTIFYLALFSGLALGTKMSSLLFLGVPMITFAIKAVGGTIEGRPKSAHKVRPVRQFGGEHFLGSINRDGICRAIFNLFTYLSICLLIFLLSSPHNFLNWHDFISSMTYESRVGLGRFVAFYTRQFVNTPPVIFQMTKILPYALGWPTLIGGILGFLLLPSYVGKIIIFHITRLKRTQKRSEKVRPAGFEAFERFLGSENRDDIRNSFGERKILTESSALIDILRFSLLLSFLPPSFFFAKWTRFISPSFPLFSLFAILFFQQIFQKASNFKFQVLKYVVFFVTIIPGVAYLSIYFSPDVRFTASEWIYKNIPANSKILSETANAIDIPILPPHSSSQTKGYFLNSFNFYDLDSNPQLQKDLSKALNEADYVIVPSRRIFKNHPKNTYPLLAHYYDELFSGAAGFTQIAEFSSYPRITLFGKTLIEFPDENAEETWSVFDHPVIRIYKKIQVANPNLLDFSDYKTINYQIPVSNYSLATSHSLFVADTPEKWEKGLMYVKNREDIGGRDGMIFIFPDSQSLSFWNKNTLSHLTLYWIQNKKVVGISDLPSITETGTIFTVSSPSPADTVLEIMK